MKLVLAEKLSSARSIAKAIGATKREDGYLQGNDYIISWCAGHLVELAQPEAYDPMCRTQRFWVANDDGSPYSAPTETETGGSAEPPE